MCRRLIAAIALILLCSCGASAQSLDSLLQAKDAELKKLREEIAEERKRISELEKKEKDASQLLAKLEKEEKLVRRLVASLGEKEAMLERQLKKLRDDLRSSEIIYQNRLAILSRRLRELYKDGSQAPWQRLLGARNFDDLVNRYRYLSAIAEQDAKLVQEVRRRKNDIEKNEDEITETLAQVSSSRRQK